MINRNQQSGFTAVELLITLFVAAAFLVSGYQLYNLIIKDSGQTRAEARASNVAYDYLRRYSATAASPCAVATPLNNYADTVTGLSAVKVTVAITCPYAILTNVSKVSVTVLYNTPQQTMKYSTYVNK
ncbi:prepilin-type N-terminal cleavage/methylation domain-containing protein [Candidatus Saccharibacteria bacterium]|nr:prepilin-type N-terminal cleavage/methylation domain-containing protein [Candidatus Saccharibacteria bacterium]